MKKNRTKRVVHERWTNNYFYNLHTHKKYSYYTNFLSRPKYVFFKWFCIHLYFFIYLSMHPSIYASSINLCIIHPQMHHPYIYLSFIHLCIILISIHVSIFVSIIYLSTPLSREQILKRLLRMLLDVLTRRTRGWCTRIGSGNF